MSLMRVYARNRIPNFLVSRLMTKVLWWMIGVWLGFSDLCNCATVSDVLQFPRKLQVTKTRRKVIKTIIIATLEGR
ncbi:hypothetical protein HanXRQr2_Chr17g0790731 [Helianthus annuus]|uniref:Uncharacterized protein n=1 Tax=Helianthus annuus TaxID=4232 RepID=A0A9K3DG78_HELAN|nr:hypothetical protein HanXRQr2_Chr17g0790731 [Helianthus annuus]KAJ0432361.1 hypothetical protein HanIR_Chr17g0858331 [Helianthus annuus]